MRQLVQTVQFIFFLYVLFKNLLWHFSKCFVPSIGPERPQVLIYDAASCHLGLEVIELALKEEIHILVLPAKSTAFLQPLDQIMHVLQVLCMDVGRHFDYSFNT